GQAVPQCRQAAPLLLGQSAKARDEFLHGLALGVGAQGQPVSWADTTRMQVVPALEVGDGLVEFLVALPLVVLFGLDVEHREFSCTSAILYARGQGVASAPPEGGMAEIAGSFVIWA